MLNKILFSLLIVCTFSCAKVPPAPSFDSKFNQLEIGKTTDEVQTLLGPPVLREVIEGKEIWHYQLDDPRDVNFRDKKVIGFDRGTPINTTGPVVTSSVNKKIGDDCQTNRECQSGNCHFKTCSGPNNCQRNLGQTCTTDNDCCGGFCDFATCKKRP